MDAQVMKRILFLINTAYFFVSHRLPVARALHVRGCEVHIAAPPDPTNAQVLEAAGMIFHPVRLPRACARLHDELAAFWDIAALIHRLRPDLLHAITIKPILYGGIAARLLRVPACLFSVTGLRYRGNFADNRGAASSILQHALQHALAHPRSIVIFQNEEDRGVFLAEALCRAAQTVLIPGSGVDPELFRFQPPPSGSIPVVLLATRLVESKGIRDYAVAATRINAKRPRARFLLAGRPDPTIPDAIPEDEIAALARNGSFEYLGYRPDIHNLIAEADILCLPSRGGEGVPKFLLEGLAAGRPIVATDIAGCRDLVRDGINGLLVPPNHPGALADAIERLIQDPALRTRMADAARRTLRLEHDIRAVVARHLELYQALDDARHPNEPATPRLPARAALK